MPKFCLYLREKINNITFFYEMALVLDVAPVQSLSEGSTRFKYRAIANSTEG